VLSKRELQWSNLAWTIHVESIEVTMVDAALNRAYGGFYSEGRGYA